MSDKNNNPRRRWQQAYASQVSSGEPVRNRSGIEIQPLYTAQDTCPEQVDEDLAYPGQFPYTRGVYPSMYRGRTWSQRQLVGLSSPEAFNKRQRDLLESGSSGVSLIPCNSSFRGLDMDQVDPAILGTCGTLVNTVEDLQICLQDLPLEQISVGLNDPLPFTFAAFTLSEASRQGIDWQLVSGTSNQSDYLSHYVANHMFFRLALPGSRRVLIDHIEFMLEHVPRWNPLSIVGQHMQQAGATPAQAMGLTLATAIQYADDCLARGLQADDFLPRFSFFFDISISFFEEVAKFRAGRRIWARITRDRFGATTDRACRLRFHAQTSGADLTRQQPMNNLARVTIQAMAGIFGGLQSLHTDAWDEALSSPSENSALLAINTQNILRDEAGLTDVIDPLGGSYYLESLTNEMESAIVAILDRIEAAGGMFKAAQDGIVQSIIGESALHRQQQIDSGEQRVVGVNCHQVEEPGCQQAGLERPDRTEIERCLARLKAFKQQRSQSGVRQALTELARAADDNSANVFKYVVAAAAARATHGEMVATLRDVYGFGQPRIQL